MPPPPRLLLAFLCLLRMLGSPVAAQKQPASPDTVAVHFVRSGAECALFPPAAALPPWQQEHTRRTGRFMPTRRQVRAAEHDLRRVSLEHVNPQPKAGYYAAYPALIHAHLADYRRQYYGVVTPQGHRCLFINLFVEHREEEPGHVPFWLREAVWTYDGGAAYWSIYYDLTTHSFFDFSHNVEG